MTHTIPVLPAHVAPLARMEPTESRASPEREGNQGCLAPSRRYPWIPVDPVAYAHQGHGAVLVPLDHRELLAIRGTLDDLVDLETLVAQDHKAVQVQQVHQVGLDNLVEVDHRDAQEPEEERDALVPKARLADLDHEDNPVVQDAVATLEHQGDKGPLDPSGLKVDLDAQGPLDSKVEEQNLGRMRPTVLALEEAMLFRI